MTLWPDAGHSVTPVEGDIPSFKEGSRADLKMQRYLIVIGAAWGGQTTGHRVIPRFALAEVALHLRQSLPLFCTTLAASLMERAIAHLPGGSMFSSGRTSHSPWKAGQ